MTVVERPVVQTMMRRALRRPDAALDRFSVQALDAGDGQDLGVLRVAGTARVGSATVPWSVIGKRLRHAGSAASSDAWSDPGREARAYASGLLADLPPGLTAPRFLGAGAAAGGTSILWLEDVRDGASPWTLDDYARVAHDLGRFNGAYLAGRRLPRADWLSRRWLRSWLAEGAAAMDALDADRRHPQVDRVLPAPVAARLHRLWRRRASLLASLDRLPQTFCHNDAFRRNLFLADADAGTVAVDWAFAGVGPVGSELAPLVWGSLAFLEAPWDERRALERAALDAYAAGLAASGAAVARGDVEHGYAVSAALRYGPGVVRLVVPPLRDEHLRAGPERVLGIPFGQIAEHWAALLSDVPALVRIT